MSLQQFCEDLKLKNDIVILGHVKPDGDAIGAALALKHALQKIGKRAYVLMKDVDTRFSFLPTFSEIQQELCENVSFDTVIVVDCSDIKRLGDYECYFRNAQSTFCIDHHISYGDFAEYNYNNSNASSTCELICEVVDAMNIELDEVLSNLLYQGIAYDTGGFRHSNVSAKVLQLASQLVLGGANVTEIMYHLFFKRSYTATKLIGAALNTLELHSNGTIASLYLSKEMIQKIQPLNGETDGIVNMAKDIEGVEVAVFLVENDDKIKVSLRSEDQVNVAKFAARFGGGGHAKASGCSVEGNLIEQKNLLVEELQKLV